MVNIVIPAYNCEKYIRHCLDSIYAGTFEDFKIIAVNDGSTDRTLSILKEYEKAHENFVVISQENQGPSVARNTGLKYVQKNWTGACDYLIFIDADDWVEQDFLSTLVSMMDKNVGMTTCGYRWQKQTKRHFKNRRSKVLTFNKAQTIQQLFIDRYLYATLWNKLLKVEYAKDLHFDESLWQGEDVYFLSEYLTNLPEDIIAKHSTKLLYHYQRTKGLSSFGFNDRKLKILDTFHEIRQNLQNLNYEQCLVYLNAWEFLNLFEFTYYMRGMKTKKEHKKLKDRAKLFLKDYRAIKNQYRPFRRYADLIFWCL